MTWYPAGTYTGTFYIVDGDIGLYSGASTNADLAGSFTLGPITITLSRATGITGTGISGNSGTAANGAGGGGWTADFSHTFTEPFQSSGTVGPMSYYVTSPVASPGKQSAGTVGFAISKT